jgi:hypothetical protein
MPQPPPINPDVNDIADAWLRGSYTAKYRRDDTRIGLILPQS